MDSCTLRHVRRRDFLIGWSRGFLSVDSCLDEWQIFRFLFDGDAVEAFEDAGFYRSPAAGERFQDGAAFRCYEAHKPPHEG